MPNSIPKLLQLNILLVCDKHRESLDLPMYLFPKIRLALEWWIVAQMEYERTMLWGPSQRATEPLESHCYVEKECRAVTLVQRDAAPAKCRLFCATDPSHPRKPHVRDKLTRGTTAMVSEFG